jgi:hypothetical protein
MNVSEEESNYILNEIRENIVIKEPKKRKLGSGGSKRNTKKKRHSKKNYKKVKKTKKYKQKSKKHTNSYK